jgi:UDP-N-acetylmuramate--alanine ligase
LTPTIAVLTNIDADHLDHFTGGIDEIKECFTRFANRVPFYGTIVLCLDDDNVQGIIPNIVRRTISYGLAAQQTCPRGGYAEHRLLSEFRWWFGENRRCEVERTGLHNV